MLIRSLFVAIYRDKRDEGDKTFKKHLNRKDANNAKENQSAIYPEPFT